MRGWPGRTPTGTSSAPLAVAADGLWAGGAFTSAGDVPSNDPARWTDAADAETESEPGGEAADGGADGC